MRATLLFAICFLPTIALGGEIPIDDFEGPVRWEPFSGNGPLVKVSTDTRDFVEGKASLRLEYKAAEPFWSNLRATGHGAAGCGGRGDVDQCSLGQPGRGDAPMAA